MKYCTNCGQALNDDDVFCPKCGTSTAQYESKSSANNTGYYSNNTGKETTYANLSNKKMLRTDRSLLKYILFGIITFGIYDICVFSNISKEINIVATKHDGKHTMHYLIVLFLLSLITLGIVPIIWMHKLCNRIGGELKYRHINYEFNSDTFWLWGVLGAFIIVGPYIYTHKLLTAMNLINDSFNNSLE